MRTEDLVLVSVDDHAVEPPTCRPVGPAAVA